jgi:hypothetical protein
MVRACRDGMCVWVSWHYITFPTRAIPITDRRVLRYIATDGQRLARTIFFRYTVEIAVGNGDQKDMDQGRDGNAVAALPMRRGVSAVRFLP